MKQKKLVRETLLHLVNNGSEDDIAWSLKLESIVFFPSVFINDFSLHENSPRYCVLSTYLVSEVCCLLNNCILEYSHAFRNPFNQNRMGKQNFSWLFCENWRNTAKRDLEQPHTSHMHSKNKFTSQNEKSGTSTLNTLHGQRQRERHEKLRENAKFSIEKILFGAQYFRRSRARPPEVVPFSCPGFVSQWRITLEHTHQRPTPLQEETVKVSLREVNHLSSVTKAKFRNLC